MYVPLTAYIAKSTTYAPPLGVLIGVAEADVITGGAEFPALGNSAALS
jgi:hypothetical protein